MNVKKTKKAYMAYSVILILLGIVLMIMPEVSLKIMCYILGGIIMACGVIKTVTYFVNDAYGLAFQFDLALGIIAIMVSILLLLHPNGLIAFIDLLLGLFVLMDGAFKMQTSIEAKKFGLKRWWAIMVIAVFTVIIGFVLMVNPVGSGKVLMVLLGLAITIYGVENLIVAIYTIKLVKRFSPILTDVEEEDITNGKIW